MNRRGPTSLLGEDGWSESCMIKKYDKNHGSKKYYKDSDESSGEKFLSNFYFF